MKIIDIIEYLDTVIPKELSESWDRDGISVLPDRDAETSSVVVALDVTSRVIGTAKDRGAGLIVSHHPLIFDALTSLDCGDSVSKRIIGCVKNNIAAVSYHTRLDECDGGVNDCLADFLGLRHTGKLGASGGRFGFLPEITSFSAFLEAAREKFPDSEVKAVKCAENVRKIAICSGSCQREMIGWAAALGCDTFFTGEAKHSYFIEAKELGINMLCASHHETENVVLGFLERIIKEKFGVGVITVPFRKKDEYGV